jgi:hypothetical protein
VPRDLTVYQGINHGFIRYAADRHRSPGDRRTAAALKAGLAA